MKTYIFFVRISLILLFCLSAPAEPPEQRWVARYNGPGNDSDVANALAVDATGNVFVTGDSDGGGTGRDYATIKYDSDGNEVWVVRYNGPGNGSDYAGSVAVDNLGNVCIIGGSEGSTSGYDFATIKYDTNGNQLWVVRYNGPANSSDSGSDLAVDDWGNVYVTGRSIGDGTANDYATVKYDPNGNRLWLARYNGPTNESDRPSDLAVDDWGNVYVTGESIGSGTSSDYATVKYDANGNQLWVARYNGLGNYRDKPSALAVDDSCNVYVTGGSLGSGTSYDYTTIKYDPNGNQLWVSRYNGPINSGDSAFALAIDDLGNVYVTGDSDGSGPGVDYATVKYDPNGDELWVARYDGPGNWVDWAYALAVDALGNVYVAGESEGSGTSRDFATIKYDENGNQLWVVRYNGPANSDDSVFALAIDGFGNVYVTGGSGGSGTGGDYATIKYTEHDYCLGAIAGDLNDNCKVDFVDFAILAEVWLGSTYFPDLVTLAEDWLKCNFALQEDCG